MRKYINYFFAHPVKTFLADGIGAFLSTLLLLLLIRFESFFGMPSNLLYKLIPVTMGFVVYSFSIYSINPVKWRSYLRIIAVANILYTILTMALLYHSFEKLLFPGIIYFVLEVIVILFIAINELKIAN